MWLKKKTHEIQKKKTKSHAETVLLAVAYNINNTNNMQIFFFQS